MKEIVQVINERRKFINQHANYLADINDLKAHKAKIKAANVIISFANDSLEWIYRKGTDSVPLIPEEEINRMDRVRKFVDGLIELNGARRWVEGYTFLARITGGRKRSLPSSKK